ncbi:hypothetical protein ACFQFC_20445 [Amorphoplanes digitatis]|uniref:Uncharacterized protein n=1 Tax=Actinoplanes digitatis TaxID=1868 RepID=A0A7W7I519_9ACTN|nr:hypothetical protein [Actinoplanes digitatis]MBB4766587.1 hypothetical protein [Actinoplanes digitatis]GID96986.1 hypothetical protein Adi01nite_63980 [Actinoplanes digitatis]
MDPNEARKDQIIAAYAAGEAVESVAARFYTDPAEIERIVAEVTMPSGLAPGWHSTDTRPQPHPPWHGAPLSSPYSAAPQAYPATAHAYGSNAPAHHGPWQHPQAPMPYNAVPGWPYGTPGGGYPYGGQAAPGQPHSPYPWIQPQMPPGVHPYPIAGRLPDRGVANVVGFTILLGFFGIIYAAIQANRARAIGWPQQQYWVAFAITFCCQLFLFLVLLTGVGS